MSGTAASGVTTLPSPTTLEDWRQCAAELHKNRQMAEAESQRLANMRRDAALAAARGDATAQRQIVKLADRENHLQLNTINLDQGLLVAAQAINALEAQQAHAVRAADLAAHQTRLVDRLVLVAEIERSLRNMAPLLHQLGRITQEIEQAYQSLGGVRLILPPLAQEAVGGRLAEFMAGCGFADWLPVLRPEIRPAITSWHAAEEVVQESYRLPERVKGKP